MLYLLTGACSYLQLYFHTKYNCIILNHNKTDLLFIFLALLNISETTAIHQNICTPDGNVWKFEFVQQLISAKETCYRYILRTEDGSDDCQSSPISPSTIYHVTLELPLTGCPLDVRTYHVIDTKLMVHQSQTFVLLDVTDIFLLLFFACTNYYTCMY